MKQKKIFELGSNSQPQPIQSNACATTGLQHVLKIYFTQHNLNKKDNITYIAPDKDVVRILKFYNIIYQSKFLFRINSLLTPYYYTGVHKIKSNFIREHVS